MTRKDILALVQAQPCYNLIVQGLDVLSTGHIRIATRFKRIDNSFIDVFLHDHNLNRQETLITDFGETYSYLFDRDMDEIEKILFDVATSYQLEVCNCSLVLKTSVEDMLSSILRFGQACLSATALRFVANEQNLAIVEDNVRLLSRPFASEMRSTLGIAGSALRLPTLRTKMHEFFRDKSIHFSEEASIPVNGRSVVLDFLTKDQVRPSAIMIVETSPYGKVLLRRADHAFAVFSDIDRSSFRGDKISLMYDDDLKRYKDDNAIIRLGEVCRLHGVKENADQINLLV